MESKLLSKPRTFKKVLGKFNLLEKVFEEKIGIGLDIGAYSVKFVQLQEGPKGHSLVKMGYREIPHTETEEDAIVQALGELWQEQKIRARRVGVAVSDSSIYSRHITIPQVSEEELAKAVKWQAEKYIPFSIDNAIVDFQTLGTDSKKGPDQMEIVLVAVKKETIDKYLSILKLAKLTPAILDVCPFAVTKLFLEKYSINPVNREELAAIIDIGAKTSSVIIIKGDSLQFVRNIELAGGNFTKAIAQDLGVDINEAEKIKKEYSIYPLEKKETPNIFSVIEPLLEELAKEINRSFAYCEKEFLIQRIDRVILCGGGARFRGLDKFLTEKLGIAVEIGYPFRNIPPHQKFWYGGIDINQVKADTLFLEEMSPFLVAATGAAL